MTWIKITASLPRWAITALTWPPAKYSAFQAIMLMLMFPMVFLSGVFFPMQNLPSWMSFLIKINLASYGVASIREAVLGIAANSPFNISLFGHTITIRESIGILGNIMAMLAMWSFGRQE